MIAQDKDELGVYVIKYVHVEITCLVALRWSEDDGNVSIVRDGRQMRISGKAVLEKRAGDKEARLLRIEDIGLDSQLNLLFLDEYDEHTTLLFETL